MRILVAPQELKGSLTASEAADAIAAGVKRAAPLAAIDLCPIADGGPGTLDALITAGGGSLRRADVTDLLGEPIVARYGLLAATAVIETAEACGLTLLGARTPRPFEATTSGVGGLLRAALDAGCRRFLIGIGGSATNDGGSGMARALGICLLDAHGAELNPGPEALLRLARIDLSGADPRLAESSFEVAVDVRNPLCGPEGATAIFGPQKGVLPEQVSLLDAALHRLGECIERDLGVPVLALAGGGAAGGLGAGLAGFLGARLRPGFEIVAEAVGLSDRVSPCDLVLTGEGMLDHQTRFGKTVAGVAALGARHGVPVVALAGGIAPGFEMNGVPGLTAAFSIVPRPMTLAEAEQEASTLLAAAAEQCVRLAWHAAQ